MFRNGAEISSGATGLGGRAGIYDAEMLALVDGAKATATYVENHPTISQEI